MPTTTTFHDFVASKIQAAWRRALDRRAFLERRRAVVVIQSLFSVTCNSALNRAVREYNLIEPGLILDKTREIMGFLTPIDK